MDDRPAGDRRRTPSGGARGRWTVLRAALYRQLAADDDRAAYWVRHVRLGVALTEFSALAVVGYALLTPGTAQRTAVLVGLAGAAVLAAPLLLVLPVGRMVRDRRGSLLFYCWSLAVTGLVAVGSRVDGGASSPLFALLFITLGFMAVAYPPWGVVAMGGVMNGAYLVCVAGSGLDSSAAFIGVVMAVYTVLCAMASANQWEAYDRQQLLLRTSEVLAATDPLTGCLNRRAFLDRLDRAAAGTDGDWVVCLVDLDGFKAVNDLSGHAAGDAVLQAVTAALTGVVRETDTVARLGGDEFAVLAEATEDDGERLAARLRDAVAVVGAGSGVTASVGLTVVRPGNEGSEVLHRADQAMYRAKGAGGNRVTALAG
ncbi:diguanylate cyclase [Geodermatophilus sp. DSM 45219]|uniref:GGDEF domain-containing protein n=1 Tax=Geodermatophilus sp. DSM 45219 TaxID=1881103 RepID=UPI000891FD9E|nr:GGDEF domain-containing protein [Geodermatophilus sp. DSM 45219]SDO21221.1 diguanylate cyclase (GGDEF) domain-containing protein [Geodermatophilus sp. DSM 45219]